MAYRQQRTTKRRNNWERLSATIEWLNMSPNSFAMQIGMTRAEGLYHIRRGEFGITAELANRITSHFPEINRTWLLTGAGNMLTSQTRSGTNIPYYESDIERLLPVIDQCEPSGYMDLPLVHGCDIIVHAASREMIIDNKSMATRLFLRHVDPAEVQAGNEYVLLLYKDVKWRKVKSIDGYELTLTALRSDISPDMSIDITDITHAWLVVAKMEMLSY